MTDYTLRGDNYSDFLFNELNMFLDSIFIKKWLKYNTVRPAASESSPENSNLEPYSTYFRPLLFMLDFS